MFLSFFDAAAHLLHYLHWECLLVLLIAALVLSRNWARKGFEGLARPWKVFDYWKLFVRSFSYGGE